MEFIVAVSIIFGFLAGGAVIYTIMLSRQREAELRLRMELANHWAIHYRAEDSKAHWLYHEFVKTDGSRLELSELLLYAESLPLARRSAAELARLIAGACKDWDGRTPSAGDVNAGLRSLWMAEVVWRLFEYDMFFDPELVRRLEELQPKEAQT